MKKSIILLLILSSLQSAYAVHPLKYKTSIILKTENTQSSNNTNTPCFVVAREVRDSSGNFLLIASGTPVKCSIHKEKARRIGKPGILTIYPESTHSVDGQIILLGGQFIYTGKAKESLAMGLGFGCGLTCLPGIGFCFLMLKGKEAILPAGTEIEGSYIDNNYAIHLPEE